MMARDSGGNVLISPAGGKAAISVSIEVILSAWTRVKVEQQLLVKSLFSPSPVFDLCRFRVGRAWRLNERCWVTKLPLVDLSRAPMRGASMVFSCPARYPVGWSRPAAWAPKSEIASTP